MVQYKVLSLNYPPTASYVYKKDENGDYVIEDGEKIKIFKKEIMPSITGNDTEEVECGLEQILNRLGQDNWKLITLTKDGFGIFMK